MRQILKNILRTAGYAVAANATIFAYSFSLSFTNLMYGFAFAMGVAQCCVCVCVELFVRNKSIGRNLKFFAFAVTTTAVPLFEIFFLVQRGKGSQLEFVDILGIIVTVVMCIVVIAIYRKLLWKYNW